MEVRVVSPQHILRQLVCEIVDVDPQSLNCDLQEVLVWVLSEKDMFCFSLVLVCPWAWNQCIHFAHIMHLMYNRGNAWECVCVYVSACVCVRVCVWQTDGCCIFSFLPQVFCQISNCFEWARQLQSMGNVCSRNGLACGWKRGIGLTELVNCTVRSWN